MKSVDGYNLTNTHTPELMEIKVVKYWVDGENKDNTRPQSITYVLHQNGQPIGEVMVTSNTSWNHTFKDLPVYVAGEKAEYTLTERPVKG